MALYFPPLENFTADGTTEAQFKAAFASLHAVLASVYAGQTAPSAIFNNPKVIDADTTVPTGHNGLSAGPIVVADGVTITIQDNSNWSIT